MIVAAAIRLEYPDGHPILVDGFPAVFSAPAPARHHDLLAEVDAALADRDAAGLPAGRLVQAQGFIDARKGFVNRLHALDIVRQERQELREPHDGHELFSENLW